MLCNMSFTFTSFSILSFLSLPFFFQHCAFRRCAFISFWFSSLLAKYFSMLLFICLHMSRKKYVFFFSLYMIEMFLLSLVLIKTNQRNHYEHNDWCSSSRWGSCLSLHTVGCILCMSSSTGHGNEYTQGTEFLPIVPKTI